MNKYICLNFKVKILTLSVIYLDMESTPTPEFKTSQLKSD